MLFAKKLACWSTVFFISVMQVISVHASEESRPPYRAKIHSQPITATAGETAKLVYNIEIYDSYHIQANPASYDYLIPAQLRLAEIKGIHSGRPVYPAGKPFVLKGSKMKLSVYSGRFSIALPLQVAAAVAPGKYQLSGSFRFQACDYKHCLPPETLTFTQIVEVVSQ